MSENTKALLSGLGPAHKVAEAWQGQFLEDDAAVETLRDAWTSLAELLGNPKTERAGRALACSVLNLEFDDHHRLHWVEDSGKIGIEICVSGALRSLAVAGLNK